VSGTPPKGLPVAGFCGIHGCSDGQHRFRAAPTSGPAVAAASLARIVLLSDQLYVFLYTYNGRGRWDPTHCVSELFVLGALVGALFLRASISTIIAAAGRLRTAICLADGRRFSGARKACSTMRARSGNFCVFFLVMIVVRCCSRESRSMLEVCFRGWEESFFRGSHLSYSRASLIGLLVAILSF